MLMLCPPGPVVMNQFLFKNIGYDSKDWVPVSVLTSVPYGHDRHPARRHRKFLC
jgi:hypothetical protein